MVPDCRMKQLFVDENIFDNHNNMMFNISILLSFTCLVTTYINVKIYSKFNQLMNILSEVEVDLREEELYKSDINDVKVE